jgi:hypothetical protein
MKEKGSEYKEGEVEATQNSRAITTSKINLLVIFGWLSHSEPPKLKAEPGILCCELKVKSLAKTEVCIGRPQNE